MGWVHLDWLASYAAVAEKGSFLRAAQSLGRVQSRISEHVAKLESDLGITLVDRRSRPIKLTVAGEVFLGRAKDVLSTIDSARAEMVALRGSTYGTVRLAATSSVVGVFVPRLIERFVRVEHNIEVQVLEGPTATLPAKLTGREADVAILPLAYVRSEPEIGWIPLWDEPIKVVVQPHHRLADRTRVPLAELENETVITPGSGDGARGLSPEITPLLTEASVRVGSTRRVASPHTLVSMVRHGLGVGLLSELALQLTGTEGVRVAALAEDNAVRHTVIAWPRGSKMSLATQRLVEFIRADRLPEGVTRVQDTLT